MHFAMKKIGDEKKKKVGFNQFLQKRQGDEEYRAIEKAKLSSSKMKVQRIEIEIHLRL